MASTEAPSSALRVSSLRSAKRKQNSAFIESGSSQNGHSCREPKHHSEVHNHKRVKLSMVDSAQTKARKELIGQNKNKNVKKKKKNKKFCKVIAAKKRASKGKRTETKVENGCSLVPANHINSTDAPTREEHKDCFKNESNHGHLIENAEFSHKILADEVTEITMSRKLESPKKPRIGSPRLQASTIPLSPKKALFQLSTIATSPKKCLFQVSPNIASQKKSSNHNHFDFSDTLICREIEQRKVFEFCQENLVQQRPASLYICGCPGTGKSLLMEKVRSLAPKWVEKVGLETPDIFTFNCTTCTNPSDIFDRILGYVSSHEAKKISKNGTDKRLKKLKELLCRYGDNSIKRMLLLVVDEIDYLLTKDHVILRELFELPAHEGSRCILIGISNSIDLADRCLQSFNSFKCRPVVIPFSPYTKEQILAVLNQRLKALPFPVFHPSALELCARKVAAASGDMRKALHVCRIAFELFEAEKSMGTDIIHATSGTPSSKVLTSCSPSKKIGSPSKKKQICSPSKNKLISSPSKNKLISSPSKNKEQRLVQIHHMAQALTKTFRCAAVEIVKSLPKHQQMVLCAAVLLFRQKKKETTLGQLNVSYLDFCKTTGMPALSVPEFSSVCTVLADQGILNLGTSREERLKRVTLQVDQDDVVFALQAIRFFCNNLT
ncbi:hypothetical protein KP509_26G021600 [Ceratopteris richardii]|uniref:Cell division control protein n=1 Tax=Ceratopteris richardii TaxID=49495 RepID=A0A8T2RJ12_CERRI|nr:hypothetical protein KP509_26G021600 [Ceratopteris richardii]